MFSRDTIIQIHAEGDTAALSRLAIRAIDPNYLGHGTGPDGTHCRHCGARVLTTSDHCTRFATDLTSAAEFEAKCLPPGYIINVEIAPVEDAELVLSHLDEHMNWQRLAAFNGPLALGLCAATLYALAHKGEGK